MKIAFDAKRLFNNFSGLGNYSRTLVAALKNLYPKSDYVLFTPKMKLNNSTKFFAEDLSCTIISPDKNKITWRAWGVKNDINAQMPDIYHGLSHDLPFSVNNKNKGTTRYVVTIHDVCFKTFPQMFGVFERVIYTFKYRHSLKIADAIVAISESTKRDILKYFPFVNPDKIHVIYQALNSEYYEAMDLETAKEIVAQYGVKDEFLLYVGSFNSRKNVIGIIEAYSLIKPESRLPLILVGSGNATYRKKVEQCILKHGLSAQVSVLSNVHSNEQLKAFYTASRALIYPSFYEGFGLPVAESLLCGTPVVTSKVSSLPEAAGNGALYVNPNDVAELSGAIEKLCSDGDLCKELAREGRNYVMTNFKPDNLTTQMCDLYTKLIQSK